MNIDREKLKWLFVGGAALTVLSLPFNCALQQGLRERRPPELPSAELDPNVFPDAADTLAQLNLPQAVIEESVPEKTGIIRRSSHMLPDSEEQWRMLTDDVFQQKALSQLQSRQTFSSSRISAEEFERRLSMIDEQIARLQKVPPPEAAGQLESLRLLKASLLSLRPAVIKDSAK